MFEKTIKFFVLAGPSAGKTMFLIGLYLKALDLTKGRVSPNNYIVDLVHELYSDWSLRGGYIHNYQFTCGTWIKKTTLKTVNYPGVHLEYIAKYLNIKTVSNNMFEKSMITVALEVLEADKLVFIIDGGKYPNFIGMGIDYYLNIFSRRLDRKRKVKCYMVVTKCDLFIDEYKDYENYDGFREFIKKKFSEDTYIRELAHASDASFYPVFYSPIQTGNGIHSPVPDKDGHVLTFGFDKILTELIK